MSPGRGVAVAVGAAGLAGLAAHDLLQRRHAILRTYPVVGHARFLLEAVGPELRQYIVTDNDSERPFSRDQRRWVYASAKGENSLFGYGSDNDMDVAPGYLIIKHDALGPGHGPVPADAPVPALRVLGGFRGRPHAFVPESIVNVSAMSYGSLSANAIAALNHGAAQAGCLHNTGEGGVSPYHRGGAGLVWQIGTGYFGARTPDGSFSLDALLATVASARVRAIEIKLSQGAKPGLGGVLPGRKVTPEVAAIRGVPVGVDCISPPRHSAFADVPGLVDFVEQIAGATGLPVGIKSAVGDLRFWEQLADHMLDTGRGPDFITIDGGEGGTGAAPLAFSDHVALPFLIGFPRVYTAFARRGVAGRVLWIGSGKLGFPERGLLALALGCDMVNVGREAMLSIGCIQAQRCHTGRCPTGVATQQPWLARGVDPADKSVRFAGYVTALRRELLRLADVCGFDHPARVPLDRFEFLADDHRAVAGPVLFGYRPGWGLPAAG